MNAEILIRTTTIKSIGAVIITQDVIDKWVPINLHEIRKLRDNHGTEIFELHADEGKFHVLLGQFRILKPRPRHVTETLNEYLGESGLT